MANLLDGIVNMIFGPDSNAMSTKDQQQTEQLRQQDRNKAQAYAKNARDDPGAQFMDGPEGNVGTGGSLIDSVAKVFKLFAGGAPK